MRDSGYPITHMFRYFETYLQQHSSLFPN
jgi:hypothetical protein